MEGTPDSAPNRLTTNRVTDRTSMFDNKSVLHPELVSRLTTYLKTILLPFLVRSCPSLYTCLGLRLYYCVTPLFAMTLKVRNMVEYDPSVYQSILLIKQIHWSLSYVKDEDKGTSKTQSSKYLWVLRHIVLYSVHLYK